MINHYTTTKGLGCIEQESFGRIIDDPILVVTLIFDKIAKPTCVGDVIEEETGQLMYLVLQ